MKRPDDQTPQPSGDHAAERLRDFMNRRKPGGVSPDDESVKPPEEPQTDRPDSANEPEDE